MPNASRIARPVVFPLFGITAEGACACGNPECSRVGKHPAVKWKDIEHGSPVPRPAPGAGVGLKTGAHPRGSDCIVVDLDSNAACDAFDELGGFDGETLTIETPRGWHLYFTHPGFHVKNSAGDLGKGIDIRGDGGFVVGPGSPHASGGTYSVFDDSPITPAPAWLLEWLKAQKAPTEITHYPGDVDGERLAYHRELYTKYLRDEAIPRGTEHRGHGDKILFDVVQRGAYDLALPVEDILELVAEHYDPRCEPQWGSELEERVLHKANDAKTVSTRPRFEPLPEDLAHLALQNLGTSEEMPSFSNPSNSEKPETITGSLGEKWGGWDTILTPPVYLLEGLIPEGKVVTFFAEGGSVKTWSALALAIAVASGKPWLGHFPVKQGKVLYLDYEDGPYEVSRRVRMLTGGVDVPELGYLYGGPHIDKVDLWKTLAHKVIDEGIRFVVVDSLGAGMPGDADENTTAFANGMKIAGRFTETGCTVLFVHHANKTGGMRGTSAARDQSDVVFKFEAVSETDAVKRMRMVCDKPGPQKRPAPVNVELSDAGLRTFEDEAADVARNATTPVGVAEAIKLALANGPILTRDKIRDAVRKDSNEVAKEVRALVKAKAIVEIEGIGFMLDDDAARTQRVLERVRAYDGWMSAAKLAKAAYVSTRHVEGMLTAGVIYPRATGGEVGGFQIRS